MTRLISALCESLAGKEFEAEHLSFLAGNGARERTNPFFGAAAGPAEFLAGKEFEVSIFSFLAGNEPTAIE